jgi:dTDP-4-dehydrorhamnose reductase
MTKASEADLGELGDSVLLTGGSGLLSLNWALALRDHAAVTLALHSRTIGLRGVQTVRSSLSTMDDVARTLDLVQPRAVVHTAGLTSVEACEEDESLAYHVNVEIARNVATACRGCGVPLVHISTDHLFRGDGSWMTEEDPVHPQNAYGRTKAAAEVEVLAAYPDALVIRTNFFGWGPPYRRSFSDTIIDTLRLGNPITLFEDVFYTPILAEALSEAVWGLVRVESRGVVNVSGDDRVSKYDFGMRLAHRFGLDLGLIRSGRLTDHPTLVRRPLDMSLSNERARAVLGRGLGSVDEYLVRLLQQEHHGLAQELQEL